MIDFARIRAALVAALDGQVHADIRTTSAGAVDGVPALPAVVVGQPKVELDTGLPCLAEITLPVAVVVARPGTNDQTAIDQLDTLLAALLVRLENVTSLDGANQIRAVRSTFLTNYPIGGAGVPAHVVFLSIHA